MRSLKSIPSCCQWSHPQMSSLLVYVNVLFASPLQIMCRDRSISMVVKGRSRCANHVSVSTRDSVRPVLFCAERRRIYAQWYYSIRPLLMPTTIPGTCSASRSHLKRNSQRGYRQNDISLTVISRSSREKDNPWPSVEASRQNSSLAVASSLRSRILHKKFHSVSSATILGATQCLQCAARREYLVEMAQLIS
ncbi:hypothetical protein K503DRAFT_584464 [Rhizopogon vinicolor AM-OR11-026]|uniref:Uncharacterized protein n=1 Tax=Rhizopogon vinicolor AM-OR11-026 TaxID=1314800 RepID=A0A1B7MJG5_9AGAM|nr:hypothetical protein K503DRAFT_584464 [Rhizopogon vinicolor AM-OR11-026]